MGVGGGHIRNNDLLFAQEFKSNFWLGEPYIPESKLELAACKGSTSPPVRSLQPCYTHLKHAYLFPFFPFVLISFMGQP